MRLAMENLTDRIENRSGPGLSEIFSNDSWSSILSWNEIRQAAHIVDFGSHGVDHPQLSLTPSTIVKKELLESREIIEFHTGHPCTHLAYPYGSFNNEVLSLAKHCNYSVAVTTISGLNQQGDDLLKLQRIAFPRIPSPPGILATVSGLSNQWQKIKNRFLPFS
jgi:peptidoglycan/xylan/chitin deacetylase (PgdA/CDA1 family)